MAKYLSLFFAVRKVEQIQAGLKKQHLRQWFIPINYIYVRNLIEYR